jgi:hypothetical protein
LFPFLFTQCANDPNRGRSSKYLANELGYEESVLLEMLYVKSPGGHQRCRVYVRARKPYFMFRVSLTYLSVTQ